MTLTLTSLPCDQCVGRSLNLCRPLDEARLRTMLSLGGIRNWKKHDTIFRAGDPMGAFFKIRSGIVAVSRSLDDGRRQIVAVRAPGDCVGYLDNDGRYAFEGEALTDVEACAFDRRGFDDLRIPPSRPRRSAERGLVRCPEAVRSAHACAWSAQVYRAGGPFLGRDRYPVPKGRCLARAIVAEDEQEPRSANILGSPLRR